MLPRILRSKSSGVDERSTARFEFSDWGAANCKLETAERTAEEMLAAASSEADAIRQQAYEEGRAAAQREFEAAVDERVKQQLAALRPALEQTVAGIEATKAAWLAEWEQTALGVAIAIAERIVRREIENVPETTLTLVRESLELAAGAAEIRLLLNPADVELLETPLTRLVAELGRVGTCTIVADAEITRGGCRLDTRTGSIDQQLAAQLARIEEELR